MEPLSTYRLQARPTHSRISSGTSLLDTSRGGDDESIYIQQIRPLISRQNRQLKFGDKVRALWKASGLLLLYNFYNHCRGASTHEETKVALVKNRWTAVIKGIVHIIPVSAATTLIVLNLQSYYIGGELAGISGQDIQKLAALQFAAKLHELFMLASLTSIVFSYLRSELVSEGLPFGAIAAGFQVSQLSFLWSPEMGGILMHKWNIRRKKLTLVLFLILIFALGATVGPSTAILMRPRQDYWPAGGTKFWLNGTENVLKPLRIGDDPSLQDCTTDTGSTACPYAYWQSVSQQYLSAWPKISERRALPNVLNLPEGSVSIKAEVISSAYTSSYSNARSIAVGPPFFLAWHTAQLAVDWAIAANLAAKAGNSRYTFRNDNHFQMTNGWQLGVQSLCRAISTTLDQEPDLSFPNITAYNVTPGTLYTHRSTINVPFNSNTAVQDELRAVLQSNRHGILWLEDPSLLAATSSSVNTVVVVRVDDSVRHIHMCSTDARYLDSIVLTDRNDTARLVSGQLAWSWMDDGIQTNNALQMMISPQWTRYINPTIPSLNRTVIEEILRLYYDRGNAIPFVEGMLSSLLLNGLVRNIAGGGKALGELRNQSMDDDIAVKTKNSWIWCMLPKSKMCTVDSAFNTTAEQRVNGTTEFHFAVLDEGYAYSINSVTSRAAVLVLIVYVVCASIHFFYMWWTGSTSDAWDTPSEITSLAMQSQPSEKLRNTGAGFETTGTFEERVRIRARRDTLEYVFRDTEWGATEVEGNKKYA